MKKFFVPALLASISAPAFGLNCQGEVRVALPQTGSVQFNVSVERTGFDQKPGAPVVVNVNSVRVPGPEIAKRIVSNSPGRQTGYVDALPVKVQFVGGSLSLTRLINGPADAGLYAVGELNLQRAGASALVVQIRCLVSE